MDAATPSREALWNIEGSWLVYPCFLLVLVVAAYFFWRRYRLWKIGRPLERGDRPLERLKGAFVDALLQVTVGKERGVGIAHLLRRDFRPRKITHLGPRFEDPLQKGYGAVGDDFHG